MTSSESRRLRALSIGVDPFDHLVQLQCHAARMTANPANWMSWNYRETLAGVSTSSNLPA